MIDFFDDTLRSMPLGTAALRLAVAVLLGGAIGWERESSARAAGLRTHMLICLAAATFAVLGMELSYVSVDQEAEVKTDPLMLISAVTSGVAFLAAGSIVINGGNVTGVTTGASMWLCGAIGLCCGIGDVKLAVIATALGLVILWALRLVIPGAARGGEGTGGRDGGD